MSECSARQTRNPVVPDSSLALTWICSVAGVSPATALPFIGLLMVT